jgi:hypothetical protein
MTPTYDSVKAFLEYQGYKLERGHDKVSFIVRKDWPSRYFRSYKTLPNVLRNHGGLARYEAWRLARWNKQQAEASA